MSSVRQLAASLPFRTAASAMPIALPLLAVERLDDIGLGAFLVTVALLPSLIAAPLVGALLDASERPRRLMIASVLIAGLGYAIAAGLGDFPLGVIVIALAGAGLLTPFGFGGFSSFVAPEGVDPHRAYAMDALSYNISSVIGPLIIAILVPTLGTQTGMLVLAAIALGSAATYPLMPMFPREAEAGARWWHSVILGLKAIVAHRPLTVSAGASTLVEVGRGAVPIIAIGIALLTTGDAARSATIVAAYAIGALVGALVETMRHPLAPPARRMIIGYALTGLATMLAAIDLGFWWVLIVIALAGVFTAAPNAAMLMLRRQDSPPAGMAQVFTVASALRVAANASGAALAGILAGLPPLLVLAGSGVVWIIGALVMLAYPRRSV